MSLAKPAIPADELGWVITRYLNSELLYWDGGGTDQYSFARDNGRAIRFARKVDADVVLGRMLEGNGRVEEHMWVNTIPASSSPSSKQEDDREWRSGFGEAMNRVLWKHRKHVQDSPGVGKKVQDYALATIDDLADDLHRMLADFTHPPDSNPPAKSEDKAENPADVCVTCSHSRAWHFGAPNAGKAACSRNNCTCSEFRPSPTKPTESVQPWPEDLSVLVGRMIVTRMKHEGTHIAPLEFVVARAYPRFVTDEFDRQAWPKHRDLLSVSPPLESSPKPTPSPAPEMLKASHDLCVTCGHLRDDHAGAPFSGKTACSLTTCSCSEFRPPLESKPQSVQSEGKVRWFRRKDRPELTWRFDADGEGKYSRFGVPGIVAQREGVSTSFTLEKLSKCDWVEEFFPTQPKDSKEMGEPSAIAKQITNKLWLKVIGMENIRILAADIDNALKSANERAEAAEKKIDDIILWSGSKDACNCANMIGIRKIVGNIE